MWSPWRYRYVSSPGSDDGCLFCRIAHEKKDCENYVLIRAELNFVLLNRYPYTTGHLMIAPYRHVSRLLQVDQEVTDEMMRLARRAEEYLEEVYRPDGLNLGMNLGEAAGAGIEQHIHLHVLPRWKGDANFMTTVGEVRIMPEDLSDTYRKLKPRFAGA